MYFNIYSSNHTLNDAIELILMTEWFNMDMFDIKSKEFYQKKITNVLLKMTPLQIFCYPDGNQ